MSHFLCVVLVPKRTKNIPGKVKKLLAPYDENKEIEPYVYKTRNEVLTEKDKVTKKVNSGEEFPNFLQGYQGKIEKMSLEEFARDWYSKEIDSDGNVLTTYNPKSRWDWWRIGGRWDGDIKGTPNRSSDGGFNFDSQHETLDNNVCPVKELPKDFSAFAIVTPDGEWHEEGKMGWWAIVINPKDETGWELVQAAIFETHRECLAVAVDIHI